MAKQAIVIHRGDQPRPAPRAEDLPPSIFEQMPGTSGWFDWHGHRTHYRKLGSGPPLVMVHMVDVGASHLEWRKVIEPLALSFTVLAVDLPGFGLSGGPEGPYRASHYVQFLADFFGHVRSQMDLHEGIRTVGSGTGASYLALMAANHPELAGRMSLVAPTGLSAFRAEPLGIAAYYALGAPGLAVVRSTGCARASILEHLQKVIYADDVNAGANEVEARHWVATRPSGAYADRSRVAGMLNAPVASAIKGIRMPVQLLWGRLAARPPADDAELWRDMKHGTQVVLFDKSGLCPHVEEAGRFVATVRDFLTRDLEAPASTTAVA